MSVCKFKAHKRCAVRATNNCKWTTLASIGKDIIEDEDGVRLGPSLSSRSQLTSDPPLAGFHASSVAGGKPARLSKMSRL